MSDAKAIDLKRYKNNRVDTPTIFQMEATECGAASLAMVLAYFGRHVSLEQMRIDCGISKNGSTAKYLLRAARAHGLEAHGYSKSVESLLKLDPPCIIHWNFNHFVVYEGIKAGRIYLNDPAHGKRVLT
ncbi:MAG: cysteine peptidase family C39 domain-containing protein, partial [Methanocorpusculum sp.]|nr:cysteine peptidase family C39 domain-containing protein [Methanocorpusculum sp.]